MVELYFLVAICAIWLFFASVHDLKTKTVPNWLSFSLIAFALGYRFFYSLFFKGEFGFFYQGLIGLGIFFLVGNLLYHMRMFAGGDAKMMVALGPILAFSANFRTNLEIFALFMVLFLFTGAIYGLFWSLCLSLKNAEKFKKEFFGRLSKSKNTAYTISLIGLVLMVFGFSNTLFFYLGILVFISPCIYIYAKSVDESCLVKEINSKNLEEGDWICHDTRVGKSTIKASWHGLTNAEIARIRKKYGKVKIREGIAFAPVFLISFLELVYVYFFNPDFLETITGIFVYP